MTRNPYVCSIHPLLLETHWSHPVGWRVSPLSSSALDDQFWFSFFHEAGHVLNAPRRRDYVDSADITTGEADDEEDANRFARDTLIPPDAYASFLATGEFGEAAITAFAKAQGIPSGVVLGRLQRAGKVLPASYLNRLKKSIQWSAR